MPLSNEEAVVVWFDPLSPPRPTRFRNERHQAGTIYRADATIEANVKRPAAYSFGSKTKHTWNGEKRDSAGMPFKDTPGPGQYNPREVRWGSPQPALVIGRHSIIECV